MSRGDTPRLWIDAVAHVAMGRDKRIYRFLHDTRFGRHVLAESHDIPDIVQAVTGYVARRLIERERALDEIPISSPASARRRPRANTGAAGAADWPRWRSGFCLGAVALVVVALFAASRS